MRQRTNLAVLAIALVLGACSRDGQGSSSSGVRTPIPPPEDSIAYTCDRWICTISHSGEHQRRVTGAAGSTDAFPDWSPDRETIVFTRSVLLADGVGQSDIYVVNADGSDERRLTASGSDQLQPRWSPDGTKILFASDQMGSLDVWVMDAQGHNAVRLTDEPSDEWDAVWHPDGELIAYTVYPDQVSESSPPEVWTMNADGSSQTRSILGMGSPSYSPDGAFLAVDAGGVAGLAVLDATSGEVIRLIGLAVGQDTFIAAEPSWSNDGEWIAYRRGLSGEEAEIYLVSADGSQERRVTDNHTFDGFPDWS